MQSFIAFFRTLLARVVAFFKSLSGRGEIETPEPVDPIGPGDVVCYYGCPNSNKAKKLQLGRTTYR